MTEYQTRSVSIAIVGLGQRGISILNCISAALSERDIATPLAIELIDPCSPGEGIHHATQPQHLITNTSAGQITVYCDDSITGAGRLCRGPSLLDWLTDRGYRKIGNQFVIADIGERIEADTFVPRAILGEYLGWAYQAIIGNLPPNVEVRNTRRAVTDVVKLANDRCRLLLEGEYAIEANYIMFATGHSGIGIDRSDAQRIEWAKTGAAKNPKLAYIQNPYPVTSLDVICSHARVAVAGTGLSAIDVVSSLTVGRGGMFEKHSDHRYLYIASGREPAITLFSRSGLPPGGKPVNQKTADERSQAIFFTRDFVDECRKRTPSKTGQLRWETDLLPTLKKEMAFAYFSALEGGELDAQKYNMIPEHEKVINEMLSSNAGRKNIDLQDHADFVQRYLIEDIAACISGNKSNPKKAVVDMIRDIQDNIRYAVDYAGLEPKSHAAFLKHWNSASNRIALGPPKERNIELLALMEAGIVSVFPPDPDVTFDDSRGEFVLTRVNSAQPVSAGFDVLVRAHLGPLHPEQTSSTLIQNMLKSGMAMAFHNGDFKPGGLAIDENLNLVGMDGTSSENIWAYGYLVEGAHYYTYVIPCPNSNSRALRDATTIARDLIRALEGKIPRRRPVTAMRA